MLIPPGENIMTYEKLFLQSSSEYVGVKSEGIFYSLVHEIPK